MAVSRAPRSPQKAMAILLGLALVFSLLLIAVSRESDLHVVHDRAGGHFEHDHHRVFESLRGASSLHGGVGGGHLARARPGDLASGAGAHGVFSSHRPDGATVGWSHTGANFGEARAGVFGGAGGGSGGGDGSSARSRAAFDHARGGDREGDVDDLFRPVPGASASRGGRVSDRRGDAADFADDDDDAADPDPFVVPANPRERASSSSSWMHEMWDETKHLTHEVEKFALKRVGTSGKRDAETARGAEGRRGGVGSSASRFADTDIRSEPVHKSASSLYAVSGADPENDDLDFANELRMRPREVDDEAEDAEIEAAEDAQQKLFDAEAIETTKPAKKGWW